MVATEPTPSGDPGETALHYPPSGKRTKAGGEELVPVDLLSLRYQQSPLGYRESAHRLHGPAQMLFEPGDEGPAVMTISPDQLELGQLVLQRQEQGFGSRLIGAIGPQDFHAQQVALGVNQQVPFAPPDFFSPRRSPSQDHAPHWFSSIGCQ